MKIDIKMYVKNLLEALEMANGKEEGTVELV